MGIPGFLPQRQLVLVDLLSMMVGTRPGERAVIAVDGPDGVGKTRLVGELVALAPHVAGRQVRAISIDGFHHPRARRYAAGRTPESFYADSYDYDALRREVLRPFRGGGAIRPAVHDVATDRPVRPAPVELADDALLLVEGIFLRRPELATAAPEEAGAQGVWDATCLVLAPETVTVPRGRARFPADRVAGDEDPEHPANARYVQGQRIYRLRSRTWQPDWIVDNADLQRPALLVPDPDEPQWF